MSITSLGKQSIIYGAGTILGRLVTFLLIPVYTNALTTEHYGIISLIYTFLGFMNVILHYGLDASLLKNYVPADSNKKKAILTNAYISFLITGILFFIILFILKDYISIFLFGINSAKIAIIVSGFLFFDLLWSIHLLILRANEKPIKFILSNILNVTLLITLNIHFVINMQLGVLGVVLSNLIASAILFFVTLPIILYNIKINTLSFSLWKKLMKFGMPFLPAGIFSMILELSDRYILKYLTNIETVGLYNAGYKFGMIILILVTAFNMGWQQFFLKTKKNIQHIPKITTYFISILCFFWIFLLIWMGTIITIQVGDFLLLGAEYWESIKIIPIIAGAYIFQGVYVLQLPPIYLEEKSYFLIIVRGAGALINIILNFILIPKIGIMGAAISTLLAFFSMATILFYINKTIINIYYEWTKIGFLILICSLFILIIVNYDLSIINKILLTTAYPLLLVILKITPINKIKL